MTAVFEEGRSLKGNNFMPPILLKIWSIIKNFLTIAAEAFEKQRKLVVFGAGILGFLLVGIIVISRLIHSSNLPSDSSRKLDDTLMPLFIPQEDFFLPDEPDFLPEVLFEQDPRTHWTSEDVRPFWRDPIDEDPEKWRERIETVIDELLEGVP
jgi:hypothetical protein